MSLQENARQLREHLQQPPKVPPPALAAADGADEEALTAEQLEARLRHHQEQAAQINAGVDGRLGDGIEEASMDEKEPIPAEALKELVRKRFGQELSKEDLQGFAGVLQSTGPKKPRV